jgi:hypothetical protein
MTAELGYAIHNRQPREVTATLLVLRGAAEHIVVVAWCALLFK